MKNKINYNKVLEDYSKEKLSYRERFEIEKAALDDDFLFEALEGFTYSEISDFENYKQRFVAFVNKEQELGKIRKLVPYRWVAGVAASILMVSGMLYVYQGSQEQLSDKNSQTIVANAADPELEENEITELPVIEEEILPSEEASGTLQAEGKTKIPPKPSKESNSIQNLSLKLNSPESEQTAFTETEEAAVPTLSENIDVIDQKKGEPLSSRKGLSKNERINLQGNKAQALNSLDLARDASVPLIEQEMSGQGASELTNYLKGVLKKHLNFNVINTDMSMIVKIDKDSSISEVSFINGCKLCFDSLRMNMIGVSLSQIQAEEIEKRLVYHFKSK